jgi:hypothetical protein
MSFYSHVPLFLVFIVSMALILLCIEGGYRYGKHRLSKQDKAEGGGSISTMVQIQLGLVAFLVAFTFGFVAQRFSERRQLVIQEANAIGTTFLRADFLPAASADSVKEILRQYVDLRLKIAHDTRIAYDNERIENAIAESCKLQTLLWNHVKEASKTHDSPCTAQFVATANETIDLQSERLYAERYGKLPDIIWAVLYLLTLLGMAGSGYQFSHGGVRNWVAAVLASVSFSIVFTMIADIDRQHEGFILVTQKPLIDLARQIGPPANSAGIGK